MTDFAQRRNGSLLGSFVADALSLGVHWIYDTTELAAKFGYIDSYHAPGSDSYHPHKKAGDQGHVGDQALCLAKFLKNEKRWDQAAFMQHWLKVWPDYNDYFDHATKTVLANIKSGAAPTEAASDSAELAGPARIAPLIAFLADQDEATGTKAAVEQTTLTHNSPAAIEAATFLATATYRILHGADLVETLKSTAPPKALQQANAVIDLDATKAIAQLGQSCAIDKALPSVIYLALKYSDDLPKAFSENAMAGGDNCARGLALGMLLGAALGEKAIPAKWKDDLNQIPVVN